MIVRVPWRPPAALFTSLRIQSTREASARGARTISTANPYYNQTLTLPDGRTLAWSECGNADGRPLLYFHGFPSSRLEAPVFDSYARRHNLRFIAPERPGFGLSSPQKGRRIVDWPADVAALAAHLRLDRFALLGASGGGPYALACAHLLPRGMLSAVGLLASAGPWEAGREHMPLMNRVFERFVSLAPGATLVCSDLAVAVAQWSASTQIVTRRMNDWLAKDPTEDEARTPDERREQLLRALFEPFAQGSRATLQEALLFRDPWGIDLARVEYPVTIYHGTHDANSPIATVRWMADRLPRAQLVEWDATHFSIMARLDEVLAELVPAEAAA